MKTNPKSILIIGSSNYDIFLEVPHIPTIGETILAKNFFTNFGGKGANQAIAISKLGGEVKFLTCLGDDIFGQLILENFRNYNIDLNLIKIINNQKNGIAIVNLDTNGKNNIVVFPGSSNFLTEKVLKENIEIIKRSKIIVTQLEIPFETVKFLSYVINSENIFILNASPVNNNISYNGILKKVNILIVNEVELSQLTEIEVKNKDDLINASEKILLMGVKNLIVTLGKEGVFIKNNNVIFNIPEYKVKVVDTTGAGDAFLGAFTYAYSICEDIVRAGVFANKVAALSVSKLGTQSAFPLKEELNFSV